ncbi:MAG: hypothetical protein IPM25_14685 [Chloracidobacterium sp.]|nr:hypothetical protein [Chloracidobacterium sp.]
MTLAGNVDEYFDLSPKRLVRDGVFGLVLGVIQIVFGLVTTGFFSPSLLLGLYVVWLSVEALAAYRWLAKGRSYQPTRQNAQAMKFCPRCGGQRDSDEPSCAACDLDLVGLEKAITAEGNWFSRRLRRRIGESLDPSLLRSKYNLLNAYLLTALAVSAAVSGAAFRAIFYFFLAVATIFYIVWDSVTRKREGISDDRAVPAELPVLRTFGATIGPIDQKFDPIEASRQTVTAQACLVFGVLLVGLFVAFTFLPNLVMYSDGLDPGRPKTGSDLVRAIVAGSIPLIVSVPCLIYGFIRLRQLRLVHRDKNVDTQENDDVHEAASAATNRLVHSHTQHSTEETTRSLATARIEADKSRDQSF